MSRNLTISLLLAVLTAGTFWQVHSHDFVNYDDPDYVTANPAVQQGLTKQSVTWAFTALHGTKTYWHPLTWLSHMLDCQVFGMNSHAHHLVNVFWHTLNVVLLFGLLTRLTGKVWRSAIVAALFAVHPLQVDTVAWVTERKNLLSTFFFITTLWAYRNYALRPTIAKYLLVFLLFALGLMAKPSIVTLPCVLLLLDFWPLRRFDYARKFGATGDDGRAGKLLCPVVPVRTLILEKLPLFVLSAASSYITIQAHKGIGLIRPGVELSLVYRLENAIVSYARYLGKVFWPADLTVLYPHPGAWPRWQVIACGVLLLVITDQAIRAARKNSAVVTGWLWFLGTLVPTIGILQVGVQAMADRFAYVPLIGLFLAVVWIAAELVERWPQRALAFGGAGAAALTACVVVTSTQLRYWKDSVTLLEHTVRVTKNNYVAHHNLGVALTEQGKFDEATTQLNLALQIQTNSHTLYALGRVAEFQQKTNDALARYAQAANIEPHWTVPSKRLADLLLQTGNTNGALSVYGELLRLAPSDPEVRCSVALLLSPQNAEQAMAHYLEALKANPHYIPALNNLAWIMATHPRKELRGGTEAMAMAKRACDLTQWKDPSLIATLAAAAAEAGKFEDAVRYAGQALALAKGSDPSNTTQLEKMLNEFKAGQTHRENL